MSDTGERDEVFRKIQAACAGHQESDVVQALLRSVVIAVGVSAPSLPRAEAVLNALPAELTPFLREKWPSLREHRAKADRRRDTIATLKKGI
jgi:hypothetical protein